jgi:N-acetylmuramoyl-L-alanine amidase
MKFTKKHFILHTILIPLLLLSISVDTFGQENRFTVVLDAGHGGHDPGAMGVISREKEINLSVVLALGNYISQNFNDVKVVYTRKTDVFLSLQERANVVNNNHADLFICIHTNAAQSSAAYGAETFTLGLAKSKANLDVAMRENSVILLEDDYKSKYKGFDPNSVDSYIMFEFMQDKYIDKSLEFSNNIQKQFVNYCNRSDRGVRQAGFWVLHRSACPSVLIELGFISNNAEERYLASENGQNEMAKAIFNAFVSFKRDHDKKSGKQASIVPRFEQTEKDTETTIKKNVVNSDSTTPNQHQAETKTVNNKEIKPNTTSNNDKTPIFKVQLFASDKKLKKHSSEFKSLKDIDYFLEEGLYKYTSGSETDYSKIKKIKSEVRSKFPNAFIIAFVGDKKISEKEALKLLK